MKINKLFLSVPMLALCSVLFASAVRGEPNDMFLIRSTAKTPEAVVEAVKAYSEAQKWRLSSVDKARQGQVILVKICIPEVGQHIWKVGLYLGAMVPCGNLAVYQQEGKTEASLLHPRYMQMLYPHPEIEKASAMALPLLTEMLDTVTK
jgi:uncharacterized protein (DUF302 family)